MLSDSVVKRPISHTTHFISYEAVASNRIYLTLTNMD